MSRRPITVRQIREILRYRFDSKVSLNNIASVLKVSKGSVSNTIKRFAKSGLPWPLPEISDSALEERLYPSDTSGTKNPELPSIEYVTKELTRQHVTLQRLYEEYIDEFPNGVKRSAFYNHYKLNQQVPLTMKMIHKGGEKLYVDYSGDSLTWVNHQTGEVNPTQLFVASWGASSFCFTDVTATQTSDECNQSHVRSFNYFGCAPKALVPDNMKTAVTKADRFNPIINIHYGKMAEHYGIAVLPARVRKPRDKAVVESNVLHIQRFILAALRDITFYSLEELRAAVREQLELFNDRPMKEYGNQTRRQRFAELDFPFANQLPDNSFEISRVAVAKVRPNYHATFENHHYSVPHRFAHQNVDIFLKGNVIEFYCDGIHICRHAKGLSNYGYSTEVAHMPKAHQHVNGWSPDWLIAQGKKISIEVEGVIDTLLASKCHPEQAFNAGMGILRLAKVHGNERLTNACRRAIFFKSISYRSIQSILDKKLDMKPWDSAGIKPIQVTDHDNIRGAKAFAEGEE